MKIRNALAWSVLAVIATASIAEELTLPEAVAAQEALTEQNPGEARLFNDLGNLLLLVGRADEAESAYRRAVELEPDLISAHFNLGLLLQQDQRPAKARREFRQALKLEPDHAWSHYQLGVLNAHLGKRSVAIKRYARALRLEPRLTDPAFNPHILDNSLAASATLRAYADLSPAELVPRTYEAPRRIAGMLVPLPSDGTDQPKKKRMRPPRPKKQKKAVEQGEPRQEDEESAGPGQPAQKPVPKPPVRQTPKRRRPN